MSFSRTLSGGRGRWPRPARVLLGSVLAALLILGLLLMHGLNHHGTASAQGHPVSPDPVIQADKHAGPGSDAAGATGQPDDRGAGSHQLEAAATCLLILFAGLILLRGPVAWRHRRLRGDRFRPSPLRYSQVLARTPSLHELCISRT